MNKTYIIVGIYLYIWAMFQKNVWRCNLCSTLLQTLLEDLKKELVFHLQNAECAQPQTYDNKSTLYTSIVIRLGYKAHGL